MVDLWCPFATRAGVAGHEGGSGGFTGGGPKIVHHTTEGNNAAGAFGAYRATGALPHFTDSCEGGVYKVWQHLPLNVAASALMHPKGTGDTNRDNAIQIEHVGFAATSAGFDRIYKGGMARLCRWIEAQTGAAQQFYNGARFAWPDWHAFSGHCGHMHVPANDHVDPGTGFDWAAVVLSAPAPSPSPPAAPITDYPGGAVRCITLHVPGLDSNGYGDMLLDGRDAGYPAVAAGTVVNVVLNTAGHTPPTAPRYMGDSNYAGHALLEFTGPVNAGPFDVRVWTAV